MYTVHLSLGTNLDDKLNNLLKAYRNTVARAGRVTGGSSVYETEPWGFNTDKRFYNLNLMIRTGLSPEGLLSVLHDIEQEMGRKRGERPYVSRVIDIDVLFYEQYIIETEDITIPHPRIKDRRFVLEPLNEIDPAFIHPVYRLSVRELLRKCPDASGVVPMITFDEFLNLI